MELPEFLSRNKENFSIKTLIAFLKRKPNLFLVENGRQDHIVYDHKDKDGLFFSNRAGKHFSYERLTTDPASEMEIGIEFKTFCFVVSKGDNVKRVYHYE